MHKPTDKDLNDHLKDLLLSIGEDPARDGLQKTPERFLRAFRFMTAGYGQDIETILNKALFDVAYTDMVIVRNIEFYSTCEHHLVPFFGKCHVGYLPKGKIVGLSKIPRIVDVFARRLQVQERMTHEISQCLMKYLNPLGVGVVVEAHHLCMMMRGVEKQTASAQTSSLLGEFQNSPTRAEFFNLIK